VLYTRVRRAHLHQLVSTALFQACSSRSVSCHVQANVGWSHPPTL